MRLRKLLITAMFLTASLVGCQQDKPTTVTLGIIEPLEHTAMTEIVAGFTDTLKQIYPAPVTIKVENAQNDANLQRAIIQKMHDGNYTMILPIGVGATQMTLATVHHQPVVSLASDLTESDRKKLNPCNVAIVHDEISSKQLIDFIHAVYPQITHLTLIHSSADKIFPQVNETIAAGKMDGITIDHVMVSSLPELTSAVASLPANTQGIFILKDNLIVSGIPTLAKAAADRHIPLMTSDQGSVQGGAAFALGVHEREIGVLGAKLAAAVLSGKNICDLPIVEMQNLTVFFNKDALQKESQDVTAITTAANQLHYKTESVTQ